MLELKTLRGLPVGVGCSGGPTSNLFVVDSAFDDTAVLRPTTPEGKRFAGSLAYGDYLTLGAPVDTGLLQADVVVQRWTPSSRMLLVSNPPALRHVQRRTFRRVTMAFGVRFAVERAGRLVTRPGEGIDLSLGGFAAVVPGRPLSVGETAVAHIALAGEAVLTVAEVVAVTADERPDRNVVRARFTQLHSTHRPALAMALHETELARVRVAGGC
ncbi:MAG TPA: PilZ domain-containing protein [Ilumatobacter sp.]|nr:PilZ domain-containing protein [Ilumatobacter sp.]